MAILGKRNSLRVLREAPPGLILDGGGHGDILLPIRYIPRGSKVGDSLDVFVYRDSEDRVIATTETPRAMVGECAYLEVVGGTDRMGAFLDWGLSKDLFLPNREQPKRVRVGDWVIVYVFVDLSSERIVATTRLNRWLDKTPPPYTEGQAVSLLILGETELGYNAIVENAHRGLLYRSEVGTSLVTGQRFKGYVRTVRPDGKIDLALDRAGYHRVAPLTDQILEALKKAGGRMPFNDDSSPEEIRSAFGVSKKAFKQTIGALYRDRRIVIEDHGIRLANPAK